MVPLLRRERWVITAALAVVIAGSWAYTIMGVGMAMPAWQMTGMSSDMAMPTPDWNPAGAVLIFLMWWIMMIAMMLPSAAPMLLLFARVAGRRTGPGTAVPTVFFMSGYLVIWGAFSLAATIIHAAGTTSGLINGMMASGSAYLSAGLLLAAGIWQLTPAKRRCLDACRTPVPFLSRIWRSGRIGAWRMGVVHGLYCVGCCWALMLLLFVGGVMDLVWIGGLAVLVLAEKTVPVGPWLDRGIGAALILASVLTLVL